MTAFEELQRLRQTIDNVDAALVHILAERFRATREVGLLKARNRLPAVDPAREAKHIARLRALAEESGLEPNLAETFVRTVMAEVVRQHEQIARTHHAEI